MKTSSPMLPHHTGFPLAHANPPIHAKIADWWQCPFSGTGYQGSHVLSSKRAPHARCRCIVNKEMYGTRVRGFTAPGGGRLCTAFGAALLAASFGEAAGDDLASLALAREA
eukprot:5324190-Amphidinium_carterae.2